ncbi:hypothetical protein [Lentilactobacillus kosonis]|uniref:Uncharacterized protein n=1 Tax=Lentilactobacillus kosonis TaxID=2810561 RepID=A0A401FPD8_9LACO|nr:hypothetical protein [Lentilactobacillus kosonis]GAY74255.1 hypothetical protein NBRC111893_2401 [Lentilactobacillus kosonis]
MTDKVKVPTEFQNWLNVQLNLNNDSNYIVMYLTGIGSSVNYSVVSYPGLTNLSDDLVQWVHEHWQDAVTAVIHDYEVVDSNKVLGYQLSSGSYVASFSYDSKYHDGVNMTTFTIGMWDKFQGLSDYELREIDKWLKGDIVASYEK